MLIEIKKVDDGYHFEANNESGNIVHIDASPAIGGKGLGARPMELLIMGLGGCSGIDVVNILKKQRIEDINLSIKIDAEREADAIPSLFKKIHVNFIFTGEIDKGKAERAVVLSLEKYCSVAKTLEASATITHTTTFQ